LDSASVLRSVWFNAENFTPLDSGLSRSLEEGYVALRAWSSTYADELSSALSLGLEAEDKLRWKVREDNQGREIFFTNGTEAWIVPTAGVVQNLNLFGSKHVLKGIIDRGKGGKGGIKVIRGFDRAKAMKEAKDDLEPIQYTDLIFAIHGIGQKLSERGTPPSLWLTRQWNLSHSRMASTGSALISTMNASVNLSKTISARTTDHVFSP
jgi:hypothetical protein